MEQARWPGHLIGDAVAVHTVDDIAWVGLEMDQGGGLVALRIEDDGSGRVLGELRLGDRRCVYAFSGSTGYVHDGRTLSICDLQDPGSPAVQGAIPAAHRPQMDVIGNTLLIDASVYDVRNPANPVVAGQFQFPVDGEHSEIQACNGFWVAFTRAWSGERYDCWSLRLDEPAAIQVADSATLDLGNNFAGSSVVHAMLGDYVYYLSYPEFDGDVYHVRSLHVASSGMLEPTTVDLAVPLMIDGELAVYTRLIAFGDMLCLWGYKNGSNPAIPTQVIDAADPTHPSLRGEFAADRMTHVLGSAVSGDSAYLIGPHAGSLWSWAVKFDVGNPSSPKELGRVRLGFSDDLRAYGFVRSIEAPTWFNLEQGESGQMDLFDSEALLTGASAPRWSWTAPFAGYEFRGVLQHDGHLYTLSEDWDSKVCRMHVFQLPGEGPPFEVGSMLVGDLLPHVVDVRRCAAIRDSTLTVLTTAGVEIYGLEDPASPRLVSSVAVGSIPEPWDLELAQDRLFVTGRWGDVRLVEVADPSHPGPLTQLHQAPDATACRSFANGSHLYVLYYDAGTQVTVLDPSDPSNTTPLTSQKLHDNHFIHDCAWHGDVAFLVGQGGLVAVNFADPGQPVVLGAFRSYGGELWQARVWNDQLFIQDDNAGILAYDVMRTLSPLQIQPHPTSPVLVRLTWEGAPGIHVEHSASVNGAQWDPMPNTEGQSEAEVQAGTSAGYFRLARP